MLTIYDNLVNQTWRRVVDLVGTHTVIILVQRSVWLAAQKYCEASLIEFDETGISFSRLAEVEPALAKALVEEVFSSMIAILTRLVGKEITRKLAEEIECMLGMEESGLDGSLKNACGGVG
jgi:hypothetical protein